MVFSEQELEAQIENHVSRQEYRPVKPKVIAKKLKIEKEDLRSFKRVLKRLIRSGRLKWGSKHLVMKGTETKSPRKDILGTFKMTSRGFGVVRTRSDTEWYGATDIYIPFQGCLDATTGDLVRIRITRKREGRDIQYGGRVEEVVERKTHR